MSLKHFLLSLGLMIKFNQYFTSALSAGAFNGIRSDYLFSRFVLLFVLSTRIATS